MPRQKKPAGQAPEAENNEERDVKSTFDRDKQECGILFFSFKKGLGKHPDWTGEAKIAGQKYRVNAWRQFSKKKTFANGKPLYFISMLFTPWEQFQKIANDLKAKKVAEGLSGEYDTTPPDALEGEPKAVSVEDTVIEF